MESGQHEHVHHHRMHSGTFQGHWGPGSVFIFFGCVWTYNSLYRYHVARRQAVLKESNDAKLKYKNSLFSIYHSGWAQAVPVEAIAIIAIVNVLYVGETITYYLGEPVTMFVHHMLFYFFFGLLGAVEVLKYRKFTIPPSTEYAAFIVANAVIAFLMTNHISGRAIVDKQMHMELVYLCVVQIMCAAVEITYKRSVTAALGRTLMFIAQGIWLCTMAVVIHPLPFMHTFDLNDHVVLDVVSSLAVVAVALALLIAFTMNAIVSRRVKKMNFATVNRIVALTYQRSCGHSGTKGEAGSPLLSDSDHEA